MQVEMPVGPGARVGESARAGTESELVRASDIVFLFFIFAFYVV